jgi:hypothetical protein
MVPGWNRTLVFSPPPHSFFPFILIPWIQQKNHDTYIPSHDSTMPQRIHTPTLSNVQLRNSNKSTLFT